MPLDIARLPEIAAPGVNDARLGCTCLRFATPTASWCFAGLIRVWVSKVRHSHETLTRALRAQKLFKELIGLEVRAAPLDLGRTESNPHNACRHSPRIRANCWIRGGDIADPELRAALTRLVVKSPR